MFQTKFLEKIETHISCSITFFENGVIYDKMWEATAELDKPQMTIWRMRIACYIPKPTNTFFEYVIIIACPPQQRLYEPASILLCSILRVLFKFILSV
jgi:hypothetical protein